jgi:hypothetical protein
MTDICTLFNKYASDKDRNGYLQCYYTLFNHLKNDPINFLEIGIGTLIEGVSSSMVGYALDGYKPGGSLRAWRDFFINGRIIGIDVQPDTQFSDEPRIETYLCSSIEKDKVDALMEVLDRPQFDVILDDGSHAWEHQLQTLKNFYPYLRPGGIYIIEDINQNCPINTYASLVGCMCNNDPYFFVGLKNNVCVIYKSHINSKRENY